MSAALVDLVSVGAQDAYITGEPQVSFWRQNYKRHTNFAIKPERMDYIGTFTGGGEVVIPIRSKGDLLSYMWIEQPNISNVGINTDGFHSTDDTSVTEFSLHVGGQEVCRMDSLTYKVSTTFCSRTVKRKLLVPSPRPKFPITRRVSVVPPVIIT